MTTENATVLKFGHPATLLAAYDHWIVLLREKQVTVGSMVLVDRSEARSLGATSPEAGAELPRVARDLEAALAATYRPVKVNYIALMLVDPHVHFHVIPRYPEPVEVGADQLGDAGWPGPPDLRSVLPLERSTLERVLADLRAAWPDRR